MGAQTYFSSRGLMGWVLAVVLAFAASTSGAAVLYEQLPLNGGMGYLASSNTPQQLADDFNPGGAVTLERITWWGGYSSNIDNNDDDFLVRIYSGVSGTGTVMQDFGSVLFVRTNTALFDNALTPNAVYQYDFNLSTHLALSSGTYFLFVQNLGSSDWFWHGAGNGNLWYRGEDTDVWGAYGGDLALRLEGTRVQVVPEPSALALLGIAGLFLALVGRRRQRAE